MPVYYTSQKPLANTKSVLSVLTQAVNQGHQILIEVEDAQAEEALAAMQ
ncbi:MAG: HPr family phosphocarrier protein [Acidobacteriota bacterium]